jgi:pilus assembly protein CpaB
VAVEDLGVRARRPERRSGGRAALFWMVALAAGGSAAMLLKWYIEKSAQPAAPQVAGVLVAAMDLPVATTIREEHVKSVDWPLSAQPPGSLKNKKDVIGRVLMVKVIQGEPILNAKLASKEAGQGLAALIPESMRAVAVRVDDVVGVAGFVHPEDRVDVIVTIRPTKPEDAEPTSKIILQNIKVLAVGKDLDTKEQGRGKPIAVTVATLLVTPEESEKLALASNQGRLLLTLRSWVDAQSVETPGSIPSALLAGVETAPRKPPPELVAAARKPRPGKPDSSKLPVAATPQIGVEILRGDRFEERKFDSKDRQ